MTLNIPLARKVIQHIEAHPNEHRQAYFAAKLDCGTTACIAGHALLLSGEYDLMPIDANTDPQDLDFRRTDGTDDYVVVSDDAEKLLGLTHEQRETLFFSLQDETEALAYLRALLAQAEATL